MASSSIAILTGRVGRDPETSYSKAGNPLCKFSMATDNWMAKDEANKTDWHECICFGKQAETYSRTIKRGYLIQVQGSIHNNNYTDNNGIRHKSYTIAVDKIIYLDTKGNRNPEQGQDTPARQQYQQDDRQTAPPMQDMGVPMMGGDEEPDVPF